MPTEPIISVSGLRGIIGESLSPDTVVRYVAAFAAELPPGDVVVGYDGRSTGPALLTAVLASLAGAGRNARSVGVAATPTIGLLARGDDYAGGVQVSASHNPAPYNGLKLFGGDGRVLPAAAGEKVKQRYLAGELEWVDHTKVGHVTTIADSTSAHVEAVLSTVDYQQIAANKFHVLVDANHGSGSVVARPLLHRLGCDVTWHGESPDGKFAHLPEPTAENLKDICEQVSASGAAVGFCQDPDADRLALIDENGRYIGEEKTLAICVKHYLTKQPGAVVTNCSTSRMTQDIAEAQCVPFSQSAVGEANVVDMMIETSAVIGGEGNGGIIHPQVGWVRDSFVGMALVLEAMATREVPLSTLADELPSYAIHKTKVELPRERIAASLNKLEAANPNAQANRRDGLRLDWPDQRQWILVRASNTEPIVRLFAEAESEATAEEICSAAEAVLTAT